MVKRKKEKKNDLRKLPNAKASTKLPASQPQSTTSRSTLGLLYQKVFDPRPPPIFDFGLFNPAYLPLVPEHHIKMSIDNAKVLKTEPLDPAKAKWTKLVLSTYRDPRGKVRDWEHAERSTRPKSSEIDGVGIVAIIQKETGPELVLQKQYRPPLDKVVIEVPAGLIDEGETAEEAALRELKEETGYVGVLSESTPIMFNDPGFCNTNLKMVHVTIDMSDSANQNLVPELEENEFIEVFTLPLKDLWETCKKWEKEGYAIDARVGTLAEGIEVARTLNLFSK
ncbi:putative adp-ribose pyrophosphatase protein [Botrytis fragariae]|uniref:Putative adp-ribose pyrophosphatase protein n=1 Tax=Botrytis fragariae TaxID=1964551 RepID=A0A8H6B1W3_9HELO|nr:putative adp-ribose pyrophosphatase protein [Botrytis fragariae]KAF5877633.1 putative adp-ribose pyrophosphatase protein [Botrytis fragariae]